MQILNFLKYSTKYSELNEAMHQEIKLIVHVELAGAMPPKFGFPGSFLDLLPLITSVKRNGHSAKE